MGTRRGRGAIGPGSAQRDGQRGYALLSVLIITGFITLVVTALMGLLFTSLRAQGDGSTAERELRALDGAMDAAINQLRFDQNSASRDACRLEPPVQRLEELTFDHDTPEPGDDTRIEIECQGSVNTGASSSADQVRLVGAAGYPMGVAPWNTASWWPNGLDVGALAATKPNLVHRGAGALQFGSGVTVRNTAAVVRSPLSASPAIEVAGDYVQGGTNPGGGGPCGTLAQTGPMQIVDLLGTSTPTCGVAPDALQLDDDPTDSIAGFPKPTNQVVPPACSSAATITLVPGRYSVDQTANLNRLLNRLEPGAPSCVGKTFHFTPGIYVLSGDRLTFDRLDGHFVMGMPKGWTSPAGVRVAPVFTDPLAELCDTTQSGVTFVLPPQMRIEHRSGRLSMCPAFSENPGQPPLPALYQETSYANRLMATPTWRKDFPTPCGLGLTDVFPAPDSGLLDVFDGPGTGPRPSATSPSFAEGDRLPSVGPGQCRVGRTHSVRVDTVDPRPLTSARLSIRGFENPSTQANLILDRRIMITVRKGGTRICTTSAQPGIGTGQIEVSIDLMTGSCRTPRPCNDYEVFQLGSTCHLDPRTSIGPYLSVFNWFDWFGNPISIGEQALTAQRLAEAQLDITQYITFATTFGGFPVIPRQTYTITGAELITNHAPSTLEGPVVNGSTEPPFRRGFRDVGAVSVPAGVATPTMPDNSTFTTAGLQTQAGVECRYLLCPVVVPAGTRPADAFVHSLDAGSVALTIPAEYRDADVEPRVSSLRLRMKLLPDHCPSEPGAVCPFLAPIELPILGQLDANPYLRQSYPGTELAARVRLTTHAGTRCVDTRAILNSTQELTVDLLDVDHIVTGGGCDDVDIDTMRDLRLDATPAADGVNRVGLSVELALPCLKDWFGNASWRCVSTNDGGRNVVFQVRPPSIQQLSVDVSSDTIVGVGATSSVAVNAQTPSASVSSSSFNVYGKVWLPRSNLEVRWNGDVTEGRPLVRDELVVGSLASQITAAPIRDQANIPAGDRYLICCDARKSESRDVKLTATAPSGRKLQAVVHFTDVVAGQSGAANRYFPGFRVEVRDWQTCDDGRCTPGGPGD